MRLNLTPYPLQSEPFWGQYSHTEWLPVPKNQTDFAVQGLVAVCCLSRFRIGSVWFQSVESWINSPLKFVLGECCIFALNLVGNWGVTNPIRCAISGLAPTMASHL